MQIVSLPVCKVASFRLPASEAVRHSHTMFIAVTNQKGGVGKSTLAVHLAVRLSELGHRVAFIDADRQGTATRWIPHVDESIELATLREPDEILERARELLATHDFVVADAPANLDDVTRCILLLADLALIPCGATVPEMESTQSAIRIIKNAQAVRDGKPDALVVFNRLPANERQRLVREAREAQHCLGFPVAKQALRLRAAFADAPGQRTVVWRLGASAKKAAAEMHGLIEEVLRYVKASPTKHRPNAQRGAKVVPRKRLATRTGTAAEADARGGAGPATKGRSKTTHASH